MDNTVNDLDHEIKFEYIFEMFETFLFFFKQKYISFLEVYNFKIPKNLILGIFLPWQILKNSYASAKNSNAALVKLTD